MTETHNFEEYHARLNQEFSIEVEPGTRVPAELVEARELKYQHAAPGEAPRTSFSLVFRAGSDVQLAQKMYAIQHPDLGERQIFLVPMEPDEKGTRYEAVFT